MKNLKFLAIVSFILLFFLYCNKLKKFDTSKLHAPSTSDWTDATALNPLLAQSSSSSSVRCLTTGVKLPSTSCDNSTIISQNGCVSGYLSAGTIKYYRYYAPSDENLSMAIANSYPANFTNCVAVYKENSPVNTDTPITELETNQSITKCQSNTTTMIRSGAYRCISVHSFCDNSYSLKIGNTPAIPPFTTTGNSNLTLPTWSQATTTYTPIEGTGTPVIGDNTYWSIPIGFNFTFFGQIFTNFYASSNGLASFSTTNPENNDSQNLFIYKENIPPTLIAPWWANLNMDCSSNIQYTTTGTSGNRVLTVQWKNILLNTYDTGRFSSADRRLNFQVKLYETSNIIELVYGPTSGNVNSNELASVGIKNTLNGKVVFINGMLGSFTDSTRYKNKSFPISGTVYRFTP